MDEELNGGKTTTVKRQITKLTQVLPTKTATWWVESDYEGHQNGRCVAESVAQLLGLTDQTKTTEQHLKTIGNRFAGNTDGLKMLLTEYKLADYLH